ncbi:chemotaxis protein [Gammaproteobacteria bacterium 42_54_T18]|nr:chemotaxis protein [Gammaproteobacteria bacterium 42_54_T18]
MAIIVGVMIITAMSVIASLNRLDLELNQRLLNVSDSNNKYVSDWLENKEAALSSFAADADREQLLKHIKQVRDSAHFDNVFLAFDDGTQQNANEVVLPPHNDDPRKWGWYKNAMANPSMVFIDKPTVAAATGANVVSLGKTIQLLGETTVLGADVQMTDILSQLNDVILPGSGYMFIATGDGQIFAHSDTRLLNQPVDVLDQSMTPQLLAKLANSHQVAEFTIAETASYVYVAPIKGANLQTVIVIERDSVLAPIYSALWQQGLVTLVVVMICVLLFNGLCNYLFRPLQKVSAALAAIAKGGGDLTQRIEVDTRDEVGDLADNFNHFGSSFHKLVSNIRLQARELGQDAQQSEHRANQSMIELASQQQEITQVVTAVMQMASAAVDIASHAENTAGMAKNSSEHTGKGREVVEKSRQSITLLATTVNQATGVISELNQHAQDINSILSTIQSIAEQTNLLALNAAIEAARAGDHGRGFSVVADEVRVLSQRTYTSTEEIQSMIGNLQQATDQAVKLMASSSEIAQSSVSDADEATKALTQIFGSVQDISNMASQIATAAEEQTQVTGEITKNTTSIKDVTDKLVDDAATSLSQSKELNNRANQLNDQVTTFVV